MAAAASTSSTGGGNPSTAATAVAAVSTVAGGLVTGKEVVDVDWVVSVGVHEGLPCNVAASLAQSQSAHTYKEPDEALC